MFTFKGTFMSVNKLPLEIYSTDNWQYLGKFLSQGRGPDEFPICAIFSGLFCF